MTTGKTHGPTLAACLVLAIAACSTSSDPGTVRADTETVPPLPTAADDQVDDDAIDGFVAAYDDAATELRSVLFIDTDPWRDLTAAIDQLRAADPLLAEFESALPAEMPDRLSAEYAAVIDAIGTWRADARAAADELEDRLDELQPVATDWAERAEQGADEPPPAEIRALVDAGRDAADRLAQECTALANAADVVVDCFALFAEPGAPDAGGGPAEYSESGTLAISIRDVDLLVDVFDASGGTSFGDRAAFDLGPMTRLWVMPAVDVRDPAGATTGELTDTMPWPAAADELDAWLAGLGREYEDVGPDELGGRSWRHVIMAPDGTATPLLVNPRADTGSIDVPADAPLHLWITDLDGLPVIATMAVGIAEDEDMFIGLAHGVLTTLRPA